MKKENKNNKKIFARVGAMLAVVLLVVLCALPAFADEVEPTSRTDYDVYLLAIGANSDDAIYHLMRDNPSFGGISASVILQFGLNNQVGSFLDNQQYITWNPPVYSPKSLTTAYNTFTNEVLHLPNGVWVTSHTTSSGSKFIYLDYEQGLSDGTRTRLFRIRYKYVDGELSETLVTANYTQYQSLENNISTWQFATTASTSMVALSYASDHWLITPVGGLPFYNTYSNFEYIYDYAYEEGDYNGYLRGEEDGYDDGYAEGVTDGTVIGFEEGRNQGFDEGLNNSTTALTDGITAIFRAPMELINSILNFEILGINMAVAVRVLISMAILGVVITIIWKAVK